LKFGHQYDPPVVAVMEVLAMTGEGAVAVVVLVWVIVVAGVLIDC